MHENHGTNVQPILVAVVRDEEEWERLRGVLAETPGADAFNVRHCWTAGEAVEFLESQPAQVVVTDEDLLDGRGDQLLDALAELCPTARRILWGHPPRDLLGHETDHGRRATAVWDKSWTPQYLGSRTRVVLDSILQRPSAIQEAETDALSFSEP